MIHKTQTPIKVYSIAFLVFYLFFIFSSTFLDNKKISIKKIAQKPQTIPINATELSPLNRLSKSTFVKLNTIKINASTITTLLNIFIFHFFYKNNPFTLDAKSFTAIANKITPNTFLIIPNPFAPSIRSILPDDFNTP